MLCLDALDCILHRVKDVNGKLFWRMMYIVMVHMLADALRLVSQMIDMNSIGNVSS